MNFRQALIVLNAVAVGVIVIVIAARVLNLRRNPEPAPPQNKTPFLPDEDLEGRKLERVLGISLLTTALIALTLFAYYVFEPSRSESADEQFLDSSVERGAILFANDQSKDYDSTRSLLCANCHGVDGKGALNAQGVDDLVNYLESIEATPEEAKERFTNELVDARAKQPGKSDGELLFQLQCARCHTKNWSFFDPDKPVGPLPGPQGGGAYGPNLTGGDTLRQFAGPTGVQDQYDWVADGKPANELYGTRGISSGRMPHFANVLTKEQIQAIVDYERGL